MRVELVVGGPHGGRAHPAGHDDVAGLEGLDPGGGGCMASRRRAATSAVADPRGTSSMLSSICTTVGVLAEGGRGPVRRGSPA